MPGLMTLTTAASRGVSFDPVAHAFTDETGRRIPSVSEVIRRSQRFQQWEQSPRQEYLRTRGTRAHQAIAYDLRGTLDEKSVDERIAGYLSGARNAVADIGLTPLFIEVELSEETGLYAGIVDLLAKGADDHIWLVDWKTGSFYDEYVARAGAYLNLVSQALGDYDHLRVVYVRLKDNGSYKVDYINNSEALSEWNVTLDEFEARKGEGDGR